MYISSLAVFVGVVAGLGSILFRYMIATSSANELNTLPVIDGENSLGTIRCTHIFTALSNELITPYITRKEALLGCAFFSH